MEIHDRTKICAHLRSKDMYTSPGTRAGNAPTDLGEVFWCNLTMKNIGPDDCLCDAQRCVAGRGCFASIFR